MISYAPLWETLKRKGKTTYTLIERHGIDRRTIYKLKHNESVTALTLEKLCLCLDCPVQDVICISNPQDKDKANPQDTTRTNAALDSHPKG